MTTSREVKPGLIDKSNDKLLEEVAGAICDKYQEVGIDLGVPQSEIRKKMSEPLVLLANASKKAYEVLLLWRERGENFTYEYLAAALKKNGLGRCADENCYSEVSVAPHLRVVTNENQATGGEDGEEMELEDEDF